MSPRVAVVAPSSPFPVEDFHRGLAWLRARAPVRDDPRWYGREGYLAGDDEARAAMLLEALADPDVALLWAARGGYGATRLLARWGDALCEALAVKPVPLVGFSDVTALHAVWSRAGVASVHGAMVSGLGRGDGSPEALWDVATGAAPAPWEGLRALHEGAAEGVARGGNLAVLAALAGTRWMPDLRGAVLLLEDVNEAPYRVDRMLTTLRDAGALDGVAAVVAGDFTGPAPGPDGVTVDAVLRERTADLGVPVLAGAPFGHGAVNLPWVSGARAAVDAREGRVAWSPWHGAAGLRSVGVRP